MKKTNDAVSSINPDLTRRSLEVPREAMGREVFVPKREGESFER